MKIAVAIPSRVQLRFGLLAFAMLAVLVLGPHRAVSQTALGAYRDCLDAAAVEASICYTNADGYFAGKKCDWAWDINNLACARTLTKALGF